MNMIVIKLTTDHMTASVEGKEGKQLAKITQDVLSTRDC